MFGGNRHKPYDISSDPSVGRCRRAVSSWLGLFLLLFNLTAGGALPLQAATLDMTAGDHMIVCTVGGMAVIDRNGTPLSPDHAGENGFCGACLPLLHGAVLNPVTVQIPRPVVQPVPRAPHADAEPALVARAIRLANPRAPPYA